MTEASLLKGKGPWGWWWRMKIPKGWNFDATAHTTKVGKRAGLTAALAYELARRHVRENPAEYGDLVLPRFWAELSVPELDCVLAALGSRAERSNLSMEPGFVELPLYWNAKDCTNDMLLREFEARLNEQRKQFNLPEPKVRRRPPSWLSVEMLDRKDLFEHQLNESERGTLSRARAHAEDYCNRLAAHVTKSNLPPTSILLRFAEKR